jgi:hypothetical protein
MHSTSPFGIFGVFFVMLGAGLILDGDWWWPGGGLIALGTYCLSRRYEVGSPP